MFWPPATARSTDTRRATAPAHGGATERIPAAARKRRRLRASAHEHMTASKRGSNRASTRSPAGPFEQSPPRQRRPTPGSPREAARLCRAPPRTHGAAIPSSSLSALLDSTRSTPRPPSPSRTADLPPEAFSSFPPSPSAIPASSPTSPLRRTVQPTIRLHHPPRIRPSEPRPVSSGRRSAHRRS